MIAVICRTCGKPVIWVQMARTAKRMPLDAEPTANGNIGVLPDLGLGKYVSIADREAAQAEGMKLYSSHLATCPRAAEPRRS